MNNRFEPTKRDMLPFHEVRHRLLVIERENSFARVRFLTNEIYHAYADVFPEDIREDLAEITWKLNHPRSND